MWRVFFLMICALGTAPAFALQGGNTWATAEYTYTDFTNKESGAKVAGRLAGIRGELGLAIGEAFAISAGGEYQDGNLNFDGTALHGGTVKGVTGDYFRDTRLLVHYHMGNLVFSSGIVQREWYSNLYGSYRRRDTYSYTPLLVTMVSGNLYFRFEGGFGFKGKTEVSMSDFASNEHDLEFTRSSGSGIAAEVGYVVMNGGGFASRMFVNYRRASLGDAGAQNDGVRNVSATKMSMDIIQAGIGVGF